jgi:hypothetical protein
VRRFDGYHLSISKAQREELAVAIGEDGFYLLQAIYAETGPQALKASPKVEILRGSGSSNFTGWMAKSIGEPRTNGANRPICANLRERNGVKRATLVYFEGVEETTKLPKEAQDEV